MATSSNPITPHHTTNKQKTKWKTSFGRFAGLESVRTEYTISFLGVWSREMVGHSIFMIWVFGEKLLHHPKHPNWVFDLQIGLRISLKTRASSPAETNKFISQKITKPMFSQKTLNYRFPKQSQFIIRKRTPLNKSPTKNCTIENLMF